MAYLLNDRGESGWRSMEQAPRACKAGDPERLALPIASRVADAKKSRRGHRRLGSDPVGTGALAEAGRRERPGWPVYTVPTDGLRDRLGAMA